ncbi:MULTISPECIES: hypothetical protein [Legionella]|uniref:DrrA phosphatidylinositol 4-phosphate binding domain-containing protein n=1 Tax=Legionella drozanskii LLAP-1 TaxID=1212489 RepID=A0A0W0TCK1_9GAMM|nr:MULTISPECIES: hypothetical protein [Legionella]KTC93149.1 exported protein of unknown function [Legionella drozanskii LLAP-1]PJE09348.1 MAG: hypothetical protein CK430_11185 [Legionella sp.]
MFTKKLNNAQTVNACTAISVAVIEAILVAVNPDELSSKIKDSHQKYQKKYKIDFPNLAKDGEGLLEQVAYQHYFAHFFAEPRQEQLTAAVTLEQVREVLANRAGYLDASGQLETDFFVFNFDAIEAIEKEADKTIDWSTISEKELLAMLNLREGEKSSLRGHFLDVVNRLENNQGITIRMDGHTISLTKRNGFYFSYDSLTGELSYTQSIDEMTDHITEKANVRRTKTAIITYFFPEHPLKNVYHATQIEPSVAHEKGKAKDKDPAIKITPELIHELVQNRNTFDETEDGQLSWQLANEELIEAIKQEIPPKERDNINWNLVREQELCRFLGMQIHSPLCSSSGSFNEERAQKIQEQVPPPEDLELSNIIIHISLSYEDYKIHNDKIRDLIKEHRELGTIAAFKMVEAVERIKNGDQFTLYVPKNYSKSQINELCKQLASYMATHQIIDSGTKSDIAEWITPQINMQLVYFETRHGKDRIDINETEDRQNLARTALKANELFSYLSQLFRKHLTLFKQFQGLHYDFATPSISREHSHEAKASLDMDLKYQKLRGDALKTAILCDFKESLSKINDSQELEQRIEAFKKTVDDDLTDEYKILATGQDRFTRMFGIQTSSIIALEAICADARQRIAERLLTSGSTIRY